MPPLTIPIVYEDRQLLICVKPAGILAEAAQGRGLPDLLQAQYRSGGKPDFIAGVHRLDRNVGGLMVFSRRPEVTGKLTAQIAQHEMRKEYLAVVRGIPEEPEGVLEDLLFRDAQHNKTFVVQRMRKGVRPAKLAYRCLAQSSANGQPCSLVQVRLYTGRTHQIRVQFASRQLPLLGDIRYGCKDPLCDVALWSYRLGLRHPKTGQALAFCQPPPAAYPWSLFAGTITPDLPPLA